MRINENFMDNWQIDEFQVLDQVGSFKHDLNEESR